MLKIRETGPQDNKWMQSLIQQEWGSLMVGVHDTVYFPHTCMGLVAVDGDENVGLITYYLSDDSCEIVTLNSLQKRKRLGSQLISTLKEKMRNMNFSRIWLVTTNDNVSAVKFYEKNGFRVVRIDAGAVDRARKVKPHIPLSDENGVEIHDEIVMEFLLG